MVGSKSNPAQIQERKHFASNHIQPQLIEHGQLRRKLSFKKLTVRFFTLFMPILGSALQNTVSIWRKCFTFDSCLYHPEMILG